MRLADVARVETVTTPSVIHRQGASRRIDVEAEVSGRSLAAVTEEVRQRVKEGAFPFEYHAEVLGENVERQAALRSVYGYLAAAAIAIVLFLQAALNSWRLAALTIAGVLVAMLGGLVTTYVVGGAITLGAFLGFAGVAGLALRNVLLQIRHFQIFEERRTEAGESVAPQAAAERLPAVVASAITTALIVLPFVVLGNVAGLEILHPAAVVILGSLVTSTIVTLFIIPPLCTRLSERVVTQKPTLTLEAA